MRLIRASGLLAPPPGSVEAAKLDLSHHRNRLAEAQRAMDAREAEVGAVVEGMLGNGDGGSDRLLEAEAGLADAERQLRERSRFVDAAERRLKEAEEREEHRLAHELDRHVRREIDAIQACMRAAIGGWQKGALHFSETVARGVALQRSLPPAVSIGPDLQNMLHRLLAALAATIPPDLPLPRQRPEFDLGDVVGRTAADLTGTLERAGVLGRSGKEKARIPGSPAADDAA